MSLTRNIKEDTKESKESSILCRFCMLEIQFREMDTCQCILRHLFFAENSWRYLQS